MIIPDKKYYHGIIVIALIALLHQVLQKQFLIQIPFLHAYLDDVLSVPLFLAIWHWERSFFWNKLVLTKSEIAFFTLFIFLLFEGVLPQISPAYTADWLDGIAYILGSGLYWWLQDIDHNTLTLPDGKENA